MKNLAFWLKFSVFNLFLVAVLGVLMRYKIAFSLPWLDQKFLQETHSHFAFYGWITACIYVLIVRYLQRTQPNLPTEKYKFLLVVNMITSFGMLVTFLYNGYFWLSIIFSAVALLTSFVFFFFLIKDLKGVRENSRIWFLAGVFFAVLSSLGVFYLSYMKMGGSISQDFYLASTYYYLHYQYNGFFNFSCIGFLLFSLREAGAKISDRDNKLIFWLMFFGCLIGFGLSVLWMKLPVWIFILIVAATISQTVSSVKLYQTVKTHWPKIVLSWSPMQRFVLLFAGFAFMVKIVLQLGSNIPAVSQFAFGFRNVVIAYLHLILLMCISTFLLSQVLATNYFKINKPLLTGLKLFLLGIFLNEAILGFMGVFSIKYISIPYSAEMLLGVSVLMLIAIFIVFIQLKPKQPN
ncbi:hypothetical protein IMZ16_01040 [Cruoricaptor ignavus]|uniref:Uncharacterized protein n=1 Tax=Cruoricaptor ignavus TaxID=1118202 RepID=A0A7M1T4I6_9FLAO|nr:hypothetical protein [Cruoricaptor ignavus]QOR74064.1 hypothetical protein IMZ16_01040 [Cruoricaptor ignavus]